jgi:formiminotetrahydrofolate cyclodeaminase
MSLADEPCGEFLANVASDAVTPSGGSVAALTGAAAASLCEMVCLHTAGNDSTTQTTVELADIGGRLHANRQRLLELADADVAAVERVQSTYGDASTAALDREDALEHATEPPIETAEVCLDVLDDATAVAAEGSSHAVADALTGVFLAHAALQAAVWTARANLDQLDDGPFVSDSLDRLADIEREGERAFERARAAGTDRYRRS